MTASWRPVWAMPFPRDPTRPVHSAFPAADITPEWAWGDSTGRGVKVAVLDSGIDARHPAVGGSVQGHVSITLGPDGIVTSDETHTDVHGHGTAVAGIIRSLAPECELYSVQVLGPKLGGRGVVFAAGLRWAIDHGMDICNLSLGTTKRDHFAALHEAADTAYFKNIALVAAVNNLPLPSFPAVYGSVISVAATEGQDPYVFYYNPRPPAEFGTVGIDVRVASLDGEWTTGSGNSYASPHIAGLVAKILGKHPGLTVYELKTILRALAANVVRATG